MQGKRLFGVVVLALFLLCSGAALAEQGSPEENTSTFASHAGHGPESEVVADRTASSQTFRLSGNKLETRLYQSPVNYPARRGGWEPIGERLRSVGGETLANGASNVDISLPKQIDTNPARVSLDGGWVTSELASATAEPVQLKGDTASYEPVDPR